MEASVRTPLLEYNDVLCAPGSREAVMRDFAAWLAARGWQEERWLREALDGATLLRFPLLIEGAAEKVRALSLRGFELGRWFDAPVAPMPDPPRRAAYRPGACPRAEWVAARIVNLPLHVRMTDQDVARLLGALDAVGARPMPLQTRGADENSGR